MSTLNGDTMRNLFLALNGLLNKGLGEADRDYLQWCNILQSSALTEEYPIMMLTGSMREWIGERVVHEISGQKLTVRNRDYEHTEMIPRNMIEDDQIAFFGQVFTEMGLNAGNLWSELATEALCNPGDWADGKPFYGERKFGRATIDNKLGELALTAANYETARKRMMSFEDAAGKSLRLVPDTVIIGPENEGAARLIFEADLVADGQNATVSNIHKGECRILVNTGITGNYSKYWFLVNTRRPIKPITVQKRKEGPLQRWDRETDACVAERNENRYGLHYRGAAFASMPQLIVGSFPKA